MYKLIRPLLFSLSKDPETVHNLALSFLKLGGLTPFSQILSSFANFSHASLQTKVFGLDFKNPVGLGAGFDKNAKVLSGLEALGFGFLEMGTVTKLGQPGNPRPRLARFSEDEALINRMGFNNLGADKVAARLSHTRKLKIPLGISLGKSKITELTDAMQDYLYTFEKLYSYGDYFVVNISSPNTPGLRQLQDKDALMKLISALVAYRQGQNIKKPLLVKIVIDFTYEAVNEILEVCKTCGVDGIICSNTSVGREGLSVATNEVGGLSGKPIRQKSTEMIRYIHKQAPNLPIVGVGGIFTSEDAYEKIKAGASLIQVYTGFIYEGPFIVKKINKGLVKLLQKDGFKNISEAVGVDSW